MIRPVATIALKVDVDTLQGTLRGVPRLLDALARRGLSATFLFSLGPDHTGWALKRLLRPGFIAKVSRTSVLHNYGWRTLAYGVLLPAPDIGRRGAAVMRACRDGGHECGIHAWDHVRWQDNVRRRGTAWTLAQMNRARERFGEIFGTTPSTHGAAGWQMNAAAMRQLDEWGMPYASDSRGGGPFRARIDGETFKHVQLPTTLPTLDELLTRADRDGQRARDTLLSLTLNDRDQVYTLHAELEGGHHLARFEELLDGWSAQGHRLGSLHRYYRSLDVARLPVREMTWRSLPGRSGSLFVARAG